MAKIPRWFGSFLATGLPILLAACTGGEPGGPGDASVSPDAPPDARAAGAELVLPPWPWWPQEGLAVDEARLADLGTVWCHESGGAGAAPAFFFGAMPLAEVASLCAEGGPDPRVLLGHMYLSGWYGGLWFRDHADLGMGEGGPPAGPVSEEDFRAIADNAAYLAGLAAAGSDAEVFAHNLESLIPPPGGDLMESMMDALLTLFGYNYGYVDAILAMPPPGADAGGIEPPCDGYLDCPFDGTPLEVYEPLRRALERLASPPDAGWTDLAAAVEQSQGWAAIGEALWSSGSIEPDAWRILVDINASYLRVTAAAALGSLLGAGDRDPAAGRCALLLEAATDTWNRAYFLALTSDAPAGTLPTIACPDPAGEGSSRRRR
ncbi:MAG: hypothetical protein FJ098_02355 [Deltaproteobacteria bacterium]|nr:hypothetical protein [Deltaproteobacteria bacterium]